MPGMQLTIQIISYCRLNARADRIFRGAQKGVDRMTTAKPISIPAVVYAMLQELSDRNRKKPDQYLHELIKREYDKKR
jgi:hypothetical protein